MDMRMEAEKATSSLARVCAKHLGWVRSSVWMADFFAPSLFRETVSVASPREPTAH